VHPCDGEEEENEEHDAEEKRRPLEAVAVGDALANASKSKELDYGHWVPAGQTNPENVHSKMRCASMSHSAGSSSCESSAGRDESSSCDDEESSESELSDADSGVEQPRGQPAFGACGSGQGSCDGSRYMPGLQPQWPVPQTGPTRHSTWHGSHMNCSYPPSIEVAVDAGPPGNWGTDAPARLPEASPTSRFPQPEPKRTPPMPRVPLASPQSAMPKPAGMARERALPPLVPQPGTVVVDFLAQDGKRRRVIRDSALTMKDLINQQPRGLRRICIADCVSAETRAVLNKCPLQGRPILHVAADSAPCG